jgi:hypothetical protein
VPLLPLPGTRSSRAATILRAAVAAAVLTTSGLALGGEPPSAKRELPDYDGREPPPAGVGPAVRWVPRLVLSPLYATNEFLLRRPLAVVVPAVERVDLPTKLYELFTFGANHQAGIFPVGFLQFGFKPSVGVYAFWRDALFAGHDLRLHVETWTPGWLAGLWTERVRLGQDTLELRMSAARRPDLTFYGIGPRTPASQRARYGQELLDAAIRMDHGLWRLSHVEYAVGVRSASFYSGRHDQDPTVQEEAARGAFPLPDGLESGYTAPYLRLAAVVDSRRPWPWSGSGMRLKLLAEEGNDVRSGPVSSWVRYELGAGAYYDLTGYQRVISLSAAAMFADPIGARPVPFTELAALGGDGSMRGFPGRRLVGRSAAVVTARYGWPVGPYLAGTVALAAGNVFDEHLSGFSPGLLRLSGTIGLAAFSQDHPFEMLFGLGTDPFDQGASVSQVVIVLSVNRGL